MLDVLEDSTMSMDVTEQLSPQMHGRDAKVRRDPADRTTFSGLSTVTR